MKKATKIAKVYSLATQGIFSMVVYTVIGFFIGYAIDKTSAWPAILAVAGMLIGLFTFVTYLLYLASEEDKERMKKNDGTDEKK